MLLNQTVLHRSYSLIMTSQCADLIFLYVADQQHNLIQNKAEIKIILFRDHAGTCTRISRSPEDVHNVGALLPGSLHQLVLHYTLFSILSLAAVSFSFSRNRARLKLKINLCFRMSTWSSSFKRFGEEYSRGESSIRLRPKRG